MRSSEVKRVAQGLCHKGCGRELVGKSRCGPCLDQEVFRKNTYVSHGLCQQACGRELVTKRRCRECADKNNAANRARRARQVSNAIS